MPSTLAKLIASTMKRFGDVLVDKIFKFDIGVPPFSRPASVRNNSREHNFVRASNICQCHTHEDAPLYQSVLNHSNPMYICSMNI